MKKLTVAERKKEQGYGVGIRQCHDCKDSDKTKQIRDPGKSFEWVEVSYYCVPGKFKVKKTGTCKLWK